MHYWNLNRLWELILKMFFNDEQDMLLFSILHIRRKNISLVQNRSNSCFQWERFSMKSQQVLFFVVLLWPSIDMQNPSHSIVTTLHLRKWANQDSSGTEKRSTFCWSSSRDSETRVPSRLWQKKYPKIEWSYRISTKRKFVVLIKETNNIDEINNLFMNSYWNETGIFVRLMRKVSLRRFQGFTFDTVARRRFVEDRDTILDLTGKIQESQYELHCMHDSTDFKDAESGRSGRSYVTAQPVFSHLIQFMAEC